MNWPKWQQIPQAELWQVVAVLVGLEPVTITRLGGVYMEFDPRVGGTMIRYPDELLDKLEIAEAHLREGLPAVRIVEERGRKYTSVVRLDAFGRWAKDRGWPLPEQFPVLAAVPPRSPERNGPWPWGTYQTKLLDQLAAAVEEHWSKYVPGKHSTAPKSEIVTEWLVRRGVPHKTAQQIARILRADDMPRGGPHVDRD